MSEMSETEQVTMEPCEAFVRPSGVTEVLRRTTLCAYCRCPLAAHNNTYVETVKRISAPVGEAQRGTCLRCRHSGEVISGRCTTPVQRRDKSWRYCGCPCPRASVVAPQGDALETQEFYDLMQSYRHASAIDQAKVCEQFEAIKAFLRASFATLVTAPVSTGEQSVDDSPLTDAEVGAWLETHKDDPVNLARASRIEWLFRKKLAASVIDKAKEWLRSYDERIAAGGKGAQNMERLYGEEAAFHREVIRALETLALEPSVAATSTTPDEQRDDDGIHAAAVAVGEYLQAPVSMWNTIERLIRQRTSATPPPAVTEAGEQDKFYPAGDVYEATKQFWPAPSTSAAIRAAAEEIRNYVDGLICAPPMRDFERAEIERILSRWFGKGEPVRTEVERRIKSLRGVVIESGNKRDAAFVEGGIAALENLLNDLPATNEIETRAGVLPLSLLDEIQERRETLYKGFGYERYAPQMKTDLDHALAIAAALRTSVKGESE